MAEGVVALEPAEVIAWGPIRQAIGIAGRDVKRIQNPQAVFQIAYPLAQGLAHADGEIAAAPAQAMAPGLLAVVEVQSLQGFLHGLVAGKTGPLVVARCCAHLGQLEIGPGLMEPVGGAIHQAIVAGGLDGSGHSP